jgi:Integrator complex subunit 3 N-terminal
MLRAILEVIKVPELEFLVNDLAKPDAADPSTTVYKKMYYNGYKQKETSAAHQILVQIPPFMVQYLDFIFSGSSKMNFNKHLMWMLENLNIHQNSISEYLLVDFIRYVIQCIENFQTSYVGEKVHRWYVLGWVMKFIKCETFKILAKQALFFDWLAYKGESGCFKIFEPTWLLIYNSLPKYKDMSEELLDFLYLFSQDFDPTNPEHEQSVVRVFDLLKSRGVNS